MMKTAFACTLLLVIGCLAEEYSDTEGLGVNCQGRDDCAPLRFRRGKPFTIGFLRIPLLSDGNDTRATQQTMCPTDQVYDPFMKKCREKVCPPGFKKVGRRCEKIRDPI